MIGNCKSVNYSVRFLNLVAQKLVKSVFIYALTRYGASETSKVSSRKGKVAQIDDSAVKGQRTAEIFNHIVEIYVVFSAIGNYYNVLKTVFGNIFKHGQVSFLFLNGRQRRRTFEQFVFVTEYQLFKKHFCLFTSLFRQQIFHIGEKSFYHVHSHVETVFLYIPVCGDVVKVFGSGYLRRGFTTEIHSVRLYQFYESVHLVGRDKSIYGVAKKYKLCLLQFLADGRKILFVTLYTLSDV